MKKKALVLFGSPRKKGFTASMLGYFLSHLEGYDVEIVNAFESDFKPCIDCKKCQKAKACVFDDMNEFDVSLRQSDLIIIASPVYNFSFPSPLKAIFDRFQRYYNEKRFLNTGFQKKTIVLLLTCGRENSDKWLEILKTQTSILLRSLSLELAYTICLKSTDNLKLGVDNLPKNVKINIRKVSKKLCL